MLRADEIEDFYKDGGFLRVWSLACGHPRCLDNAIAPGEEGAEAVLAANAAVRADVVAVTAYEEAARLVAAVEAREEPLTETVTATGPDGEPVEAPNPAWLAYQDALATAAGASERTRALALVRAGEAPPETLEDGTPNPDRAAYDAALALIGG